MAEKKSWKEHYWHTVPCMKMRIEEIVRRVSGEGKQVLEVGCNEGFLSQALIEEGCKVTSCDYDQVQIDKAKQIFGIEAIKANINDLPFSNDSFDVVVAGEVLEHIENPFVGLSELFRVARERIIISIPVGEYWMGELTHQWQIEGCAIEHDTAHKYELDKHLLILEFNRKRDVNFVDIPPFDTKELKKRYGIS